MKRILSEIKSGNLAKELRDLDTLSDDELKARWRLLYDIASPQKVHRSLLLAAVAHRVQEKALGSLKSSVRRRLLDTDNLASSRSASRHPRLCPKPGTILVRDWGGVTHQATVLEHGILFRSKLYKSLSEVARIITGTRWSGPLFFGLRTRR